MATAALDRRDRHSWIRFGGFDFPSNILMSCPRAVWPRIFVGIVVGIIGGVEVAHKSGDTLERVIALVIVIILSLAATVLLPTALLWLLFFDGDFGSNC
jgi:Mn2+/Fe2+ NRAMP family transporter